MKTPHICRPSTKHRNAARGVALIEALVALLIMAFGMVALAGLQGTMRRSADLAKQRGEAMRFAQRDLELLRDFSVLTPVGAPAGSISFDSTLLSASLTRAASTNQSNTDFTLTRTIPVAPVGQGNALMMPVRNLVQWIDRAGDQQSIQFDTFIARVEPGLGGSLGIAPSYSAQRRAPNANSQLPPGAKDLVIDHKRVAVYKPVEGGTAAWVFNPMTGVITSKCTVPAGVATLALVANDVTACQSLTSPGYLLHGYVRFAISSPPDPAVPNGTALPLDAVLATDPANTGAHAALPSYECYDNAPAATPSAQTSVSYACIVYPNATVSGALVWSGRLQLSGFTIGGTGGWNVCRYSADYDGNHAISNSEHPLNYSKVAGSLVNQNFLVIPSTENCPAGQPPDPAHGRFSNTQTVLTQPIGSNTPTPI